MEGLEESLHNTKDSEATRTKTVPNTEIARTMIAVEKQGDDA